ncbi:MAG TPA: ATP-binding protein [Candidatus Krumholzibacteria bacterium]|nr:ATP-binding protein [Candidatus Krumholzibacteria bacterium]
MQRPIVSARTRPTVFVVFLAAFAALLVLSNLALYRRARTHLDAQLGERLRAIATAVAHEVEDARPDSLTAGTIDPLLYDDLLVARVEQQLSNIVVVSADGRTAIDLAGYSEPGDENPFIELDAAAVTLARAGVPAYTSLYRTGDVYMKSAYAPIHSAAGAVIGVAGVEAGASFFAQLRELRDLIVLISLGNASVVVLLGFLFYRRTRSLERAREAMIEKDNLATLGRMVATIAHEIRNPLSIIRASAERVRRRHDVDDEALAYITEEVDGLDRVLTGYLQFAKSQPAAFAPVAVERILRRALVAIEAETAAKHIALRVNEAAGLVIRGDERRARQAVLNVLLNAVQATPQGGTIAVTLQRDGDSASIAVADGGPGIEPAMLKDVTRPFFTTRVDGSGLGLTVVRSVMEEHGGELRIESAAGAGAHVTLSFPLDTGASAGAAPAKE